MAVRTTLDFGRALCAHFGLPAKQVLADVAMNTSGNQMFSATVTITLTPDDLVGIATHMRNPITTASIDPMAMSPGMAEQVRKLVELENAALIDRLQRTGRI